MEPHPAGVVLLRPGYYTLPPLDELAALMDDDGSCVVENLVVGREGFGNVLFPGQTNVSGLNLDDISETTAGGGGGGVHGGGGARVDTSKSR